VSAPLEEIEEFPSEDEPPAAKAESPWWAMALAVLFFIALAGLVVLVLYRIYPTGVAHKTNPGFIDLIFENPLVVFAARVLLLSVAVVLAFAGVFVVVSVVSWMKNRQWLTRAGPFEVSTEISTLRGLSEFWQQQALAAGQESEDLTNRLQETEQLLDWYLREGEGQLDQEGNGNNDDGDDSHEGQG
jgi:hypothetical protein